MLSFWRVSRSGRRILVPSTHLAVPTPGPYTAPSVRVFRAFALVSLLAAVVADPACGGTVSSDSPDPDRYGGDATGPGGHAGSVIGTAGSAGARLGVDASVVGSGGRVHDAGPDAQVQPDASVVDGGDASPPWDGALDAGIDVAVDASEDASFDAALDVVADVALDAPPDVVPDAPVDVVVDAPVDAAVDANVDAALDAEPDAQPPATSGFWEELPVTGPSPRWGHGVAHDSARDRVVLFGGWPGPSPIIDSETWEWDGVRWELVAPAGAGPRTWIFFGMVYDPVRELTLVHGGYTNMAADACGSVDHSSATWGWDGTEWALRSCEGPAARGLELAYDSARDRVVTLAGGTSSSETWEWDGEHWALIATEGPPPRQNYALAFDPLRSRVVLFGGSDGLVHGDTWEWDGTAWEFMTETGPLPAQNAAMAYFAGELQRTVLYVSGETWQWDGRAWTRVDVISPTPRVSAAMAYDADQRHILLFGGDGIPGDDHVNLGDTWIYGVHRSLQ